MRGCCGAALLLILFPLGCVGCGRGAYIIGVVPAPVGRDGNGAFLAGAARTDLTPPPGYPTGGNSVAGAISRGTWTRLHARSIYLQDGDGHAVVLVATELWSMPAGLADRVAESLSRLPETRHLGRSNIMLAATHTHHGPSGFATSPMYNKFAGKESGFDPHLFEFLAARITDAIVRACRDARPATLHFGEGQVAGVARNRSLEPFLQDAESAELIAANTNLPVGATSCAYPSPLAYRALDATTRVLVARDARNGQPIALAAFFAAHPTTLAAAAPVYSAEMFGVAARVIERATGHESFVAALFNGAEGDISPVWDRQDRATTLTRGRLLAHAINEAALRATQRVDGSIECRFDIVPMSAAIVPEPDGRIHRTSKSGLQGVALIGGAEDARTDFYYWGWSEGKRRGRHLEQGEKEAALDCAFIPLTSIITSLNPPPTCVPLGVCRVGPLVVVTLPGEFTTVMGRRVAEACAQAAKVDARQVLLIGLCNEYLSYFTTPQEYALQHYEGASTLYGPYAGMRIQSALVRMTQSAERPLPASRPYRFAVGPERHFTPRSISHKWNDAELAAVLRYEDGRSFRGAPSFEFVDTAVNLCTAPPHAPMIPKIAIEQEAPDGTWHQLMDRDGPEDDSGHNVVAIARRMSEHQVCWRAIWLPGDDVRRDDKYRFKVVNVDGSIQSSPGFELKSSSKSRDGLRVLQVGQRERATISARRIWNRTRIGMVAGGHYRLVVEGDQHWHDLYIETDADGYTRGYLKYSQPSWRRSDAPLFTLIGSIDTRETDTFIIGTHRLYTSLEDGELCCFANDIPSMYWNNFGSVVLTVERIAE